MRRLHICLLALLLAVSCDGADRITGNGTVPADVTAYISAVSLPGAVVSFHGGDAPAGASGPTVDMVSPDTVITGGSSRLDVMAGGDVTSLAVGVEGLPGWWEIILPTGTRDGPLHPMLRFSQSAPVGTFDLRVIGVRGVEPGRPVEHEITVLGVGTGALQISVSWDLPSDLDLHVVEPGGEEIYFGNRLSESGGLLDLDSNRNCDIDNVNNENITWPEETPPPPGTYTVRVNLWDSCGQNGIDDMNPDGNVTATVTVMIDGVELSCNDCTRVLSGPGNNGALGAGIEVLQFSI
jgi:hypothetical protein